MPRPLEKVVASIRERKERRRRRKPRKRRPLHRVPSYPTDALGVRARREGEIAMDEVAKIFGWTTRKTRNRLKRDGVARKSMPDGGRVPRYFVFEADLRRVYPEHYERIQRNLAQPDQDFAYG